MRSNFALRIKIILSFIILLALAISTRLYFVQVMHGEAYSEKAQSQYVVLSTLFDRGSIFFESKNGERIPAATVAGGYVLAIRPSSIKDPESTYEKISEVLELDRERFIERASGTENHYREIVHRISEEDKTAIESMNLSGVYLSRQYWRFYPGRELAASTVGFLAYEGNSLEGRYGLEKYYEDILSRDESNFNINFFAEIFSSIDTSAKASKNSGDVILYIDPVIQRNLEDILKETRKTWNSKSTMGIIMDPSTGAIYAMAEVPTFDLNQFNTVGDMGLFSNSLVSSVYEMGSIVKALTLAAGIDAGVINPNTSYNDTGSVTLDGRTISNYDGRGRGVVSMQEVLSQSLNTGVTYVMLQMGTRSFSEYMASFGLKEKTGIDLPNEARNLTDNLSSPRRIEYATASFGQGIALTPISIARALSVLANGGFLVQPHIVKEIQYESGEVFKVEHEKGKRVISTKASEDITRMLIKTVDSALLGGTVALNNHSIAAKTGTAQIAVEGGRGYYEDRFLHSFFGYFPAYDPQFLVFLINIEPKGVRYASETLTHPFIDLVQFLVQYYEIPPDR